MTLRGIFGGVLILAALEAVLSRDAAAGRVGGLLEGVGSVVQHVLSPAVPAIPDLRGKAAADIAAAAAGSTSSDNWNTRPTAPAPAGVV